MTPLPNVTSGTNIWVDVSGVSAGVCAPFTPVYDLGSWSNTRPVSSSLPSFTALRGGITYSYTADPKRGTGRTSDMLWDAACAKDEGQKVIIVVADAHAIHACLNQLNGEWWGLELTDFVTISQMRQGNLRGMIRKPFIDHHAWDLLQNDAEGRAEWQKVSTTWLMLQQMPPTAWAP